MELFKKRDDKKGEENMQNPLEVLDLYRGDILDFEWVNSDLIRKKSANLLGVNLDGLLIGDSMLSYHFMSLDDSDMRERRTGIMRVYSPSGELLYENSEMISYSLKCQREEHKSTDKDMGQ